MAGILIGILVVVLEAVCWLFGAGLADVELPKSVLQLWSLALFSIPLTGFGSLWLISNRRRYIHKNRMLGSTGALLGLLLSGFWGYHVFRFETLATEPGRMISSIAFLPACLLLNAGLKVRSVHVIEETGSN